MTCGAAPLAACTNDDVVAGLAQVSTQLHGLSGFLMFEAAIATVVLVTAVVVLFVNGRG